MNGKRLYPFDFDECSFYLDCVSSLAEALHDAIANDPNEGPNFHEAAYGIKLPVDYINCDVREAAKRCAQTDQ